MPHEKPESHLQHVEFALRQPVYTRELIGFPPAVFTFPRQAVANREALGRQVAHQPQGSNKSAEISTQVDDQSRAAGHGSERRVEVSGKPLAIYSRKECDPQIADLFIEQTCRDARRL